MSNFTVLQPRWSRQRRPPRFFWRAKGLRRPGAPAMEPAPAGPGLIQRGSFQNTKPLPDARSERGIRCTTGAIKKLWRTRHGGPPTSPGPLSRAVRKMFMPPPGPSYIHPGLPRRARAPHGPDPPPQWRHYCHPVLSPIFRPMSTRRAPRVLKIRHNRQFFVQCFLPKRACFPSRRADWAGFSWPGGFRHPVQPWKSWGRP